MAPRRPALYRFLRRKWVRTLTATTLYNAIWGMVKAELSTITKYSVAAVWKSILITVCKSRVSVPIGSSRVVINRIQDVNMDESLHDWHRGRLVSHVKYSNTLYPLIYRSRNLFQEIYISYDLQSYKCLYIYLSMTKSSGQINQEPIYNIDGLVQERRNSIANAL